MRVSVEKSSWRSRVRWLLFTVGVALLVAGLMLVPTLWDFIPRPTRRLLIERFLIVCMVGYGVVVSLSLAGLVVLGTNLVRLHRRGGNWRPWARAWLLSASMLIALVMAEAGATAWQSLRIPSEPRLPESLPPSPGNALRLVVIGESSARGYPYNPKLSIGQIVAWRLRGAVAQRRVELEILAEGGANLEGQYRKLAQIKYKPDALIVYCGHNEFWTRYPWARRARPSSNWLEWTRRHSPLCRLIDEAIDRNRVDAPPEPSLIPPAIDWPACDAAEHAVRLADFRRRLERILAFCKRLRTLPILVIPPANDDGWEPNRSVLPASATAAERAAVAHSLESARSADADQAEAAYESLLSRWPQLAEGHFRLARILVKRGRLDDARRHFIAAREADGFINRCPEAFQDVYRDLASEETILIDGPAVLRATSPHGMLDYSLFHDAHHPSFRGHLALASAVVQALHDRGSFGWPAEFAPDLDPAECAAHFSIDDGGWVGACAWAVAAHRAAAKERHDPTERLLWADRFEKAARALGSGARPEETRVPGLGVNPRQQPEPDASAPADAP